MMAVCDDLCRNPIKSTPTMTTRVLVLSLAIGTAVVAAFSPVDPLFSQQPRKVIASLRETSSVSLPESASCPPEVVEEQLTLLDKNLRRLTDGKGLLHFMEMDEAELTEDVLKEIDEEDRFALMSFGGERGRYGYCNTYANLAAQDVFTLSHEEIVELPASHMARRGIDRKKYKQFIESLELRGKDSGIERNYYGFRVTGAGHRFYIREGMVSDKKKQHQLPCARFCSSLWFVSLSNTHTLCCYFYRRGIFMTMTVTSWDKRFCLTG